MPVDQAKRLASAEIKIEIAEEKDAYRIAEGVYACFPESSLDKKEPRHLRPPTHETRVQRLAKRIQPSFSQPGMHWIKAVHIPSSTIIGAAGWASPTLPVHNIFRRSAITFYGWKEKMGWSDADVDEMFAHVDDQAWSGNYEKDDEIRSKVVGEPHWYLATLITWPKWQGRGVGKRLLTWAIEKADKEVPPTPMYLESSATARAVYMHVGFVPQGDVNFLRRGPRVLRGLEAEVEEKKIEKVDVEAVAEEIEADLAS
ncbi:acyl-CoA N-acyltransferase [Macroventuria anomochaeta]|uniref:Acyl-CoA N-acyltransferase n=1 Tax=Macroventuria anomochaeta TaxID=301207 RepID=A0ACB6RHR1_9PLEO|nr:acyl-CoA N-acyltransferase [Macroventuria anomochaeta]KAF2621304.1 acyl-CoA N-acyltransferase [Macroventuria anomochaeta]